MSKDFANKDKWYEDLIQKAQLASYGPSKGSMIIRPRGAKIWERIKEIFNEMIIESGHENAYFPSLIPESFINKEKDHVEGFAPELFTVSKIGEKELNEKLFLRPTSEVIIWDTFKKWINSHRDLPILINQWGNVFRAELRTKLFLRTSEFLWQEGHTAHKTKKEAMDETLLILNYYKNLMQNYLAIPVFDGIKTESEKFAGAISTYCIEALMQDNKVLQAATSHYFGQNFSKAFDVKFNDVDGSEKNPYSSSWGISTRLIGALIMSHSDEKGLVLPPEIASEKIVVIPIFKQTNKTKVLDYCKQIVNELKKEFGARSVIFDTLEDKSPGWKFSQYELFGIPLRLEIGERDIDSKSIMLFRRDNLEKSKIKRDELLSVCKKLLKDIQENLFKKREKELYDNIFYINDYDSFKKHFAEDGGHGFVVSNFNLNKKIEEQIKKETKTSIRLIPFKDDSKINLNKLSGKCMFTLEKTDTIVLFARSH